MKVMYEDNFYSYICVSKKKYNQTWLSLNHVEILLSHPGMGYLYTTPSPFPPPVRLIIVSELSI